MGLQDLQTIVFSFHLNFTLRPNFFGIGDVVDIYMFGSCIVNGFVKRRLL